MKKVFHEWVKFSTNGKAFHKWKILPRMEECRCRKKICSWNRTFILTELASWLDVYPVWTFIRTGRLSCLDVHSTRTFILTERSSEPDVYPATRVYKLSCSFRVSRPPGGGLPFDWNGARKPSRILPLRVERSHAGWCSADPVQNVKDRKSVV